MVELIFASGVLLVASVAGYGAQVRSATLIDASRTSTVAMSDLETCMEELLVESAAEMTTAYPAGEPVASYTDLHLPGQLISPEYPGLVAGSPAPDPLEIVLTARWLDPSGHERSLQLVTAKAQ